MTIPTTTPHPGQVVPAQCEHKGYQDQFQADVHIDPQFADRFIMSVRVKCRYCGQSFYFPTLMGKMDVFSVPIYPSRE